MKSTLAILASLALLLHAAGAIASEAPVIDHQPIREAARGEPLTVRARIVSPLGRGILEPAVFVRVAGTGSFARVGLHPEAGLPEIFSARLPGSLTESGFEYFLEAFDDDGLGPSRVGTPEAPLAVRVLAAAAPIAVVPAPDPPAAPAVATAVSATAPAPSARSARRTWGLVVGGVGGGAFVAGGVFGVLAIASYRDQRAASSGAQWDRARSELVSRSRTADALLGVGALAAATGLYLYLGAEDGPGAQVALGARPDGAALVLAGRY